MSKYNPIELTKEDILIDLEKAENKVKDLTDVLNRCTEEKHNFELLCNSFKERNNQLTKELEEVKLDNIKLAKQVEDSIKDAIENLRNALAFAARSEEPYVAKHIADKIMDLDTLIRVNELISNLEKHETRTD